jgi:hypothetical protein
LIDTIVTVLVVGAVLILPFLITNVFVAKMYYKCSECRSLNARRRANCRICGHPLITSKGCEVDDNRSTGGESENRKARD